MRSILLDPEVERSGRSFHLFVYGASPQGGRPAELPADCQRIASATVAGTLYDIDGAQPALVLAGAGTVDGEVWRCPVERLAEFDATARLPAGLFRRVGVQVGEYPCWVYVAGPKLAQRLVPARRLRSRERTGKPG